MAGEINWGLLDTSLPGKIANSFYEGQQQRRQNRLADMELANAERSQADDAAVRSYYQQAGGDTNRLLTLAQQGGQYKLANDLQKQMLETEARRAGIAKDTATTGKMSEETAKLKLDYFHEVARSGSLDPSDANLANLAKLGIDKGVWSFQEAQQELQSMLAKPPLERSQLLSSMGAKAEQMMKRFTPNISMQNTGQFIMGVDTNPVTNPAATGMRLPVEMSPAQVLADRRAREDIATRREANAVAREGNQIRRVQDVEMKLADDYRAESKGFSETSTAMKKVLGAIETADKNPGSALAAGTAFMKLLDPNSVVRESELGMALNASGWFDRAKNIGETLKSGRVMTPTQKKNLRAAAETLFEEAKAAQREVDAGYASRAKSYGGAPENVILDRGQNVDKRAPAALAIPGLTPEGAAAFEKYRTK